MAYELPLVRVYQQLANVSPTLAAPDLPACVVGRCYHVMTYAVNKDDIYVEMYDKANGNSFVPQNDIAGTFPVNLLCFFEFCQKKSLHDGFIIFLLRALHMAMNK